MHSLIELWPNWDLEKDILLQKDGRRMLFSRPPAVGLGQSFMLSKCPMWHHPMHIILDMIYLSKTKIFFYLAAQRGEFE